MNRRPHGLLAGARELYQNATLGLLTIRSPSIPNHVQHQEFPVPDV